MARVTLIVPTIPSDVDPAEVVSSACRALAGAGHEVEALVAFESGSVPPRGVTEAGGRLVGSTYPGRAAAVMAGLERSTGEILLLLDPGLGYDPADLPRLVEPLSLGEADLTVASRSARGEGRPVPGRITSGLGRFARMGTGTSDPFSGLIGLTRAAFQGAGVPFHPVGRQFSFELLAKIGGRWVEVPVRTTRVGLRRADRPSWDDVRHLKRLADHRFGEFSRLIQYCVVGGSGMVVDLFFYFVFQAILGRTALTNHVVPPTKVTVALAASRALAIGVALIWNFNLNRRLTFSYARRGSAFRQFLAYLASNALGVALSLALSLGLPRKVPFFNQHKLLAAVVGIVVATGVSFSMSRWVVFRRKPTAAQPDPVDDEAPLAVEQAV